MFVSGWNTTVGIPPSMEKWILLDFSTNFSMSGPTLNGRGCGGHTLPLHQDKLKCSKFVDSVLKCYCEFLAKSFEEWPLITALTNSFRSLYREGRMQKCELEKINVITCFKARWQTDPHKAQVRYAWYIDNFMKCLTLGNSRWREKESFGIRNTILSTVGKKNWAAQLFSTRKWKWRFVNSFNFDNIFIGLIKVQIAQVINPFFPQTNRDRPIHSLTVLREQPENRVQTSYK